MRERFAGCFLCVLFLACGSASAAEVSIQDLHGAWTMQRYDMTGDRQKDVSGVLVLAEDHFGLVYTMRTQNGVLEGRGHAGSFAVDGDQLLFDVKWWVQDVEGAAAIMPVAREAARIRLSGDTLELHFGSGSMQRWHRGSVRPESAVTGAWMLEGATSGDARYEADGLFVMADGQFAFAVALDNAGSLSIYGGSSLSEGCDTSLKSHWRIDFANGRSSASNLEKPLSLSVDETGSVRLRDASDITYRLAEAGGH
jgi:hypothetical protein